MIARIAVAPFLAFIAWELAAKVDRRLPTPSALIRGSRHCQPAVRHFLEPCQTCPHRRAS